MRIALELSGLMRSAKDCWPTLKKHLIDQNGGRDNWDIFIATWEPDPKSLVKDQPGDSCTLQEVLNLYKPVRYTSEVYNEEKKKELAEEVRLEDFWNYCRKKDFPRKRKGRWIDHSKKCEICKHETAKNRDKCRCCGSNLVHNGIAFTNRILQCSVIRFSYELQNNFVYDLVIRSRFDNYFLEDFQFKTPENGKIYIPAGYANFKEFGGAPNDQMAWGRSNEMLFSSSVFSRFNKLAKQAFQRRWDSYPHSLIQINHENNNLKVEQPIVRYVLHKKLEKLGNYIKNLSEDELRKVDQI